MIKPLNEKARQLLGDPLEPTAGAGPSAPAFLVPDRDLTGPSPVLEPSRTGPPMPRPSTDDGEQLVQGYAYNECCPSFAPGWEVDQFQAVDPCPWQSDLMLCYSTCYWTAQVPDNVQGSPSGDPGWLDRCGQIQNDWRNLCVIPDTR